MSQQRPNFFQAVVDSFPFQTGPADWTPGILKIFVTMPKELSDRLHEAGAEFYQWPDYTLPEGVTLKEKEIFVRHVTSFMTTDEHVE